MDNRSAVQTVWRAARDGLARLNQILAEGDRAEDAVFLVPPRGPERTDDVGQRLDEARNDRRSGQKPRRPQAGR